MAWLPPESRPLSVWLLVVLVGAACSGREMVLGGDPNGLSATAGGGDMAGTGAVGGTTGGAPAVGGGIGGVGGATGGAPAVVGGSGGSATAGSAGTTDVPVAGAANDPYPPVTYDEGQGYRTSCPSYDGAWGFTCWHHEDGASTTCGVDGTPSCNACSCAVPCGPREECPSGKNGELAECVGSTTTVKSCFIVCDETDCPLGMVCSDYPGTAAHVCMWTEQGVGQAPPR